MPRKQENSGGLEGSVRERLLEAAITIFAQKGYTAASVNDIVDLAGVTKPVLYYHFRNKEGIYTELMNKASSEFLAVLQQSDSETDPLKKLSCLCRRMLELFTERIDFIRFIYSIYYGPPQGAPSFDIEFFHYALYDIIRSLLKEAAARGLVCTGNLEDQTYVVIGALNCCTEAQLCHADLAPGQEGLQRMLAMILYGIASDKYRRLSIAPLRGIGSGRHSAFAESAPNRKRK